jgi:hypothetical protein
VESEREREGEGGVIVWVTMSFRLYVCRYACVYVI